MTSVTCPLGSFKTYRIHALIKPFKHAQRHRLYEERRRRDNINEEIQELSHLVPMHRLDDEKARKHILNNPPLSPILAATIQNDLPMCAFSNLHMYIYKHRMSRGYGFVRFSDEGDQQRAHYDPEQATCLIAGGGQRATGASSINMESLPRRKTRDQIKAISSSSSSQGRTICSTL